VQDFEEQFMKAAEDAQERRDERTRAELQAKAERQERADALVDHARTRFAWASGTPFGRYQEEPGPGGLGTNCVVLLRPASNPEYALAVGSDLEGRLWYIDGPISEKWNWKQTDALKVTEAEIDRWLIRRIGDEPDRESTQERFPHPPSDLIKEAVPPRPGRQAATALSSVR
jgi:hypothetical protein